MAEIQRQIEADRKKLEEKKDMEEEEKKKVEDDLRNKEDELKKAQYVDFILSFDSDRNHYTTIVLFANALFLEHF